MRTALIVDSDEDRSSVVFLFQNEGFRVVEAEDSGDGLRYVLDHAPDIVVINEDMPPLNGLELLPVVRRLTDSPIIVIGSGGQGAIVTALLQGADAYLTRPVDAKELMARSRALLRRHTGRNESRPDPSLNQSRGVELSQVFTQLSHTEARLFRYMLEQGDRLVGREELVTRVWGEHGKDTSLRFYVKRLRHKLAQAARVASIDLLNLKGKGYLLKVHPSGTAASQP